MANIIKRAEGSLQRVIEFYGGVGTPLSYQPQVIYSDTAMPGRPDALASVPIEAEAAKAGVRCFSEAFGRTLYRDFCGIDLTRDAVAELTSITSGRLEELADLPPKTNQQPVITVYPLAATHISGSQEFDELMAHEYWHLVEQEREVFKTHPLIAEGTATYAETHFANRSCSGEFTRENPFSSWLYDGAAAVVEEQVGRKAYQTMLDPRVRDRIQDIFLSRFADDIVPTVRGMIEAPEFAIAAKEATIRIPEFRELQGNVTPNAIIEVYRRLGANKMAEELGTQDLSGLIDWYKRIGFE